MASTMCSFSSSLFCYKGFHSRIRQLANFSKPKYSSRSTSKVVLAKAAVTAVEPDVVRRSGNYAPTLYSYDYIQSISSEYAGEGYKARAESLKDSVKMMISKMGNDLQVLEMIGDLERLGISYHFEKEIRNILKMIYQSHFKSHQEWSKLDLKVKALGFRVLRQHGYQVPDQGIFHNFKEEIQSLKPEKLEEDMMETILNLYEASYLSFEDELILDEVREFTTKYLKDNQHKINDKNSYISSLVNHALECPLHWRVPRVEARWFIQEAYERRSDMNPILVELAILDFNMVQAIHMEDLKETSRWWENIKWDKKLPFARDRLVEHFLWATGFSHLPQHSFGRKTLTRATSSITCIDDVYDVYGTLDELERFTAAIERWDINAIEDLPEYMKICFVGFYNTINDIAHTTLADTGFFVLPYLKKGWTDICKAYLVEAKWFNSGYIPTLKEYLDNAYVSISGPVLLVHCNFLTSVGCNNEILQCMTRFENIVYYSALILRLADDLGTSTLELARGDTQKSIQCYMHESGATEEEARRYIKELIMETWKKLNKERALAYNSQFAREFIDYAANISRTAQFMYSEGDGHGCPEITTSHITSLFFNPIQKTN